MSLGVSLISVSKTHGAREALQGVDVVFSPGRISVVMGPNGSGKTTLLRMVAGLDNPSSGSVEYIDGNARVAPGLALMRRMTLVSQSPVLFNMSVYDNVAYGLKRRGLDAATVKRRVDEALEAVGAGGLARMRARRLSGGESQRVALARAYALRPELVMLDEPTANLDPDGAAMAERLIARMRDGWGASVVVVTHNIFQAKRLADHACLIYGGRVVEQGEAAKFFGSPKDELTRAFLSGALVY